MLKNICQVCGQGETWNNIPLVLQLDHIDGNRINNQLENLRIICPNCHTQTKTYGSKNIRKEYHIKSVFCKQCSKVVPNKNKKFCSVICSGSSQRKVERPSKEELENQIKNKVSFVELGKKYGVSDNSVRKWAKKYKII